MWELLSFVLRSKQRVKIIKFLDRPSTPNQISSGTGLAISHVSRSLAEFRERGIVKLMNPKAKMGRIYVLTPKGKNVLKSIK